MICWKEEHGTVSKIIMWDWKVGTYLFKVLKYHKTIESMTITVLSPCKIRIARPQIHVGLARNITKSRSTLILFSAPRILTFMLVVAYFANTKWCKKPENRLKPWHMGTRLRVLSEGYPMNTNTAGFGWFSKIFAFSNFGQK